MKRNNLFILIAGGALALSLQACNVGKTSSDPSEPVSPTMVQEMTPTAQPATATAVPTVPASACSNPYLPVVTGATWNYKVTGSITDAFSRSIVSVEAGGFTDQDVFSTGTRQGGWNCDNGNLTVLDPVTRASTAVSTKDISIDFKATEVSGVTLPASVKAGDSWTQSGTIEGNGTIKGNGADIPDQQILIKEKFTGTCKAADIESITVEAGTFNAIKIECQTAMDVSMTLLGQITNNNPTFTSTTWYAEKVGMVKAVFHESGSDNTTELASYQIP